MSDELENLPPKLTADFGRAVNRPVGIPATVDATILLAGRRFANRRRWFLRGISAAGAAAAVIAVVVMLMPSAKPAPHLAMDVDRSGRVDILDAYNLAKALPNGQDVTGDGKIDQADVDAIATAAVDLKGGPQP